MKTFLIIVLAIVILMTIYYFLGSNDIDFAAEVNGAPVYASNAIAKYSGGRLSIYILMKEPGQKTISINVNTSRPGLFLLNSYLQDANGAGYSYDGPSDRIIFVTNNTYSGKIDITKLDLTNKEVSGTFEYSAQLLKDDFNQQIVRITKGSFNDIVIE